MLLELTVRSHLRGALASYFERLLTERLQALPGVAMHVEGEEDDYDVFFAGGVVQPDGYRDANFILVTVATAIAPRISLEDFIPRTVPHEDRARLIARLSARADRYRGAECHAPAVAVESCADAVKRLDDVSLQPARRRRG